MAEEFFDFNCQDDGSETYDEYIIPAGITGPDGSSPPEMTMNGPGGTPQLIFKLDTQILANDVKIYELFDES